MFVLYIKLINNNLIIIHSTQKMLIFLGLTKSVVNGIGDLPVVGGFLKNLGKTLTGGISGLPEVIRVYADDPSRAINALLKYVNRQGPIGVCIHLMHTILFIRLFSLSNCHWEANAFYTDILYIFPYEYI